MNLQLQESNAVVIARLQAESAERIAKFNAEAGESDEVKLAKSAEKITIAKMKFGAEAGESDAVKIARIKIEAEAGDSDAVKLARLNAEVAKSAERIAIAKMKIDAETNAAQGTSSWFVSVCCVCVSFHLVSCVVFPVRSEIVTLCPVCLLCLTTLPFFFSKGNTDSPLLLFSSFFSSFLGASSMHSSSQPKIKTT